LSNILLINITIVRKTKAKWYLWISTLFMNNFLLFLHKPHTRN